MGIPFYLVDAFADRPFAGNPAVVCALATWREERWLQDVAAEMNQSDTAFVVKNGTGFDLRWFTPKVEVSLCGHATLASAHALWQQGLANPKQEIHFSTKSGLLNAARRGDEIELDFPLAPAQAAEPPADLLPALGVTARYVGRNQFDYLVEVESEAVLRQMKPDFTRLKNVASRGTIVTARSSDPRFDFVSRFFAPAVGLNEDPVTGSAHCCLGDFWHKRLGKSDLRAFQASARGGTLRVRVEGERVFLAGKAVTVAAGELREG
jgi:PhzF family phenazine biosynthesis protein